MTSSKKQLRYYQQNACQALHKGMEQGEIPYASILTGLGKSLVLAALTNRYVNNGERVLQITPRLELVTQNYSEAYDYMDNKSALGIVCGQLNKRQINKQAIICMASSFVNLRTKAGSFDRILIDENHLLHWRPDDQKPGTYQKIIKSLMRINPNVKVCGTSGTAFRSDQGELWETSHKALPFFTKKVYDTAINPGIKRLIEEGHLSHIEVLNTPIQVDLIGVKMSGQEYNRDAAGVKFDAIIEDAVNDMRNHFDNNDIKTAIVFTSTLKNAKHIMDIWGDSSTMRIVCGDESICSKSQRKAAVDWIKNGSGRRIICNVDILTTGFDHKALDCVVLLRATTSPGLLVQMIGRVIRPHESKAQGFVLDYGSNLTRLTNGGIEEIIVPKVKKKKGECPKKQCGAVLDTTIVFEGLTYRKGDMCAYPNILSAKRCKCCQAEFISVNEDGLYTMRTKAQALAIKREKEEAKQFYEVSSVVYSKHSKNEKDMIKVELFEQDYNGMESLICADFICIEHSGSAQGLAIAKIRSLLKNKGDYRQIAQFEGGVNVKNLLFVFENYHEQFFRTIKGVTVNNDGRFKSVVSYHF